MINLLIVHSDPNICKGLLNGTATYVKNIRPSGISYTVKDALDIVKKQKIDIVIIDYDIEEVGIKKFLDYLNREEQNHKTHVILLASKKDEKEILESKYTYKVVYKPIELTPIVQAIREIYAGYNISKQSVIKEKINKELEKLQYNFAYVGTQYMAEAIYEIYSKNYIYTGGNLNRNIYPIIAENHNTNVNNVKCNITAATKIMSQKCSKEVMEDYCFCDDFEKPKVKEIMYKIINRL